MQPEGWDPQAYDVRRENDVLSDAERRCVKFALTEKETRCGGGVYRGRGGERERESHNHRDTDRQRDAHTRTDIERGRETLLTQRDT